LSPFIRNTILFFSSIRTFHYPAKFPISGSGFPVHLYPFLSISFNSLFVLGDIEEKSLSSLKEITDYILVYNEEKNTPNERNSISEIGNYFINQGNISSEKTKTER